MLQKNHALYQTRTYFCPVRWTEGGPYLARFREIWDTALNLKLRTHHRLLT
jgi:hypothetical protein